MSNEIKAQYLTGKTLYAVIVNSANLYWYTTTPIFEAYNGAVHWTTYVVALTENGATGLYVGNFPTGINTAGKYQIFVYNRVGGTASLTTDIPPVAAGEIVWSGTAEVYVAPDASGRVDVAKVSGATQTARDIGASVLLSSGTGTGQLSLSSGLVALTAAEHTAVAADTQTGLTAQGYTTTRAGYLDTLNGLVQVIWDKATSALTTAGSIGKLLVDNINATISSRSTYAGGAVASVAAGVTVTTNNDKTGYALTVTPPTAAAVAAAVWTDLLVGSDFSTSASIGKLLKDNVNAQISASDNSVQISQLDVSLSSEIGGVTGAVDQHFADLGDGTLTVTIAATGMAAVTDVGGSVLLLEVIDAICATTSGDLTGANSGTEVFTGRDGSTVRVTSEIDSDENRVVTYG